MNRMQSSESKKRCRTHRFFDGIFHDFPISVAHPGDGLPAFFAVSFYDDHSMIPAKDVARFEGRDSAAFGAEGIMEQQFPEILGNLLPRLHRPDIRDPPALLPFVLFHFLTDEFLHRILIAPVPTESLRHFFVLACVFLHDCFSFSFSTRDSYIFISSATQSSSFMVCQLKP